MTKFVAAWPATYEVRILSGLPATGPLAREFHATTRRTGREGLVVQVSSSSNDWVGNFERGDGGLEGVFATPSPRHLCAIARGRAYWVDVETPNDYEIVASYPVQALRDIAALGLLVFADYTDLVAYDQSGERWRSLRVSWDGIRIERADATVISGKAWNAVDECEVDFAVDPVTGFLNGGSAPPGG